MARMIRKQAYLKEHHQVAIRKMARRPGVSEASLIRQAIDGQLFGGQTRFAPG
jgi:hypothetical protein